MEGAFDSALTPFGLKPIAQKLRTRAPIINEAVKAGLMFFISLPVDSTVFVLTGRCFTIDGPLCTGRAVDESPGISSDNRESMRWVRQTDSRVGHFEVPASVTLET